MLKKLIILVGVFSMFSPVMADTLLDQIDAAFVGHAKLSMEVNTKGLTQFEYLDNVFEIGKIKGMTVGALDFGVLGTVLPDSAQFKAADFTSGAKIHLDTILKQFVILPPEWQFLNTVGVDGRVSYDFRVRHPYVGLALVYPFK